jgi:hypothetical protein
MSGDNNPRTVGVLERLGDAAILAAHNLTQAVCVCIYASLPQGVVRSSSAFLLLSEGPSLSEVGLERMCPFCIFLSPLC